MASMVRLVVMRTDATTEIGTGHLMRCRSLAYRLRDFGVSTRFLMAECPEKLRTKLVDEGFGYEKVNQGPGTMRDAYLTLRASNDADWIVVDGYHFGSSYQARLKSSGTRMLFIDDFADCERYFADVILNQNVYATGAMYRRKAHTATILAGPKYALLKPEFVGDSLSERRTPRTARRILVTLGGADKGNLTAKVLRAIDHSKFKNLEVNAVIGAINQNALEIRRICASSKKKMKIFLDIENMAEMMRWADLAIVAGGTTVYEMAETRTPSVLLVTADNQALNGLEFSKRGLSSVVEAHSEITEEELARSLDSVISSWERRKRMIDNLRGMVDGHGPERVLMAMEGSTIWMRRVERGDSEMIREWANDDETRRMSFTTAKISKETHAAWFNSLLKNRSRLLLIGMDCADSPVGSVRIDSNGRRGALSIIIDPSKRGRGYGREMISMACRMGAGILGLTHFDAFVKKINKPSLSAFQRSNFNIESSVTIRGAESYHLVSEASRE